MKEELITGLYDLVVYITYNYSSMPHEFRMRFSETYCIILRQGLFNSLNVVTDYE